MSALAVTADPADPSAASGARGFNLLALKAPALRVDLRGITPCRLAGLSAAEVERLPVGHGNRLVPLAEFFQVRARSQDALLVLEGELDRFDRVGWQMQSGRLVAEGDLGHHCGGAMAGGELLVAGHAGHLAGCEMRGGLLRITGAVGDFAGGALPGSMDGMRGGTLVVGGHAGERCGDRMRRGTLLVHGNAGDFCAARMVAGTLAVAGRVGAHLGLGMRRGSVVLAGPAPRIGPCFVPAVADAPVFWQLLARDLARHGGAFAGLAQRPIRRWLGDLSAAGKGELIVADPA